MIVEAILALVASVIAALVIGRWQGRSTERRKIDAAKDEAYRETRERMDDAEGDADPGVLRDWLRQRGRE